jgi:hypothetical protein
METLYEMYFDEKLDFVSPPDRDACDAADMPICLMKDILARRNEFVVYTFGLTTHLRFLATKWVPDVLSHSKGQDLAQVGTVLFCFIIFFLNILLTSWAGQGPL